MASSPSTPQATAANGILLSDFELIDYCSANNISSFTFFLTPAEPITCNNPYTIRNEILSKVSDTSQVSLPTRNGNFLIQAFQSQAAKEILQIQQVQNIAVSPKLCTDNIIADYLFHDVDPELSLEDIIADLKQQNLAIYQIHRFTKNINGVSTPLSTIKVRTPTPHQFFSDKVHIGVTIHHPRMYIERPRQCQKCWQFGHRERTCRSALACKFCSEKHDANSCPHPTSLCCRNCKSAHSADFADCSKRTTEKDILHLKREQLILYNDAKRMLTISYAAKAKTKATTETTQPILSAEYIDVTVIQDSITKAITESIQQTIQQTVTTMLDSVLSPIRETLTTLQHQQAITLQLLRKLLGSSSTAAPTQNIPVLTSTTPTTVSSHPSKNQQSSVKRISDPQSAVINKKKPSLPDASKPPVPPPPDPHSAMDST